MRGLVVFRTSLPVNELIGTAHGAPDAACVETAAR